jgi:hypothetical protein
MANRFCWELLGEEEPEKVKNILPNNDNERKGRHYFRVHSGLYIHDVENISINDNFKKMKQERYINLLTMHASENEINMVFSGHKTACIKIKSLCVYLKDLHAKYPTRVLPQHE